MKKQKMYKGYIVIEKRTKHHPDGFGTRRVSEAYRSLKHAIEEKEMLQQELRARNDSKLPMSVWVTYKVVMVRTYLGNFVFRFTFTETYNKPVADFFKRWLSLVEKPKEGEAGGPLFPKEILHPDSKPVNPDGTPVELTMSFYKKDNVVVGREVSYTHGGPFTDIMTKGLVADLKQTDPGLLTLGVTYDRS